MILFYCRLICILAFKHWHPHPVGHSFSLLNHSVKWAVWPPCPHARQKFDKPTTAILNCYKIYMTIWFFVVSVPISALLIISWWLVFIGGGPSAGKLANLIYLDWRQTHLPSGRGWISKLRLVLQKLKYLRPLSNWGLQNIHTSSL